MHLGSCNPMIMRLSGLARKQMLLRIEGRVNGSWTRDWFPAALAQSVEHIIRNDGVRCSNHLSGTTSSSRSAPIAPYVEPFAAPPRRSRAFNSDIPTEFNMPAEMTKMMKQPTAPAHTGKSSHNEKKPKVKLYNPFEHHFVSQHKADPFGNLFDQKPINDDF